MAKKTKAKQPTVMIRITREFTERLDRAVTAFAQQEREQGRARKIGRATIVYEAMRRGLPLLEHEVHVPEAVHAAQETF